MKNRFSVQLTLKLLQFSIQFRYFVRRLFREVVYFVRMAFFSFKRLTLRFKKFRLDCKVFALYLQCLFLYRKYHVADPPIGNRLVKLCYEVHKIFYKRHGGWGLQELAANAPDQPAEERV